jgi:hypothetical protein
MTWAMMKASETTPVTIEIHAIQCVLVDSWRWTVPRSRRTKQNLMARSRDAEWVSNELPNLAKSVRQQRTRVDNRASDEARKGDAVRDLLDEGTGRAERGRGDVLATI